MKNNIGWIVLHILLLIFFFPALIISIPLHLVHVNNNIVRCIKCDSKISKWANVCPYCKSEIKSGIELEVEQKLHKRLGKIKID